MTVVLLSQGAAAMLSGTWSTATASTARLFSNDPYSGATLAEQQALTESDFTEAAWVGYSNLPLTGAWPQSGGGPTTATHAETAFSVVSAPASPVRVHGYYVTRDSDGLAIYFEVFTYGPYVISRTGEALAFQPVLTID